MSKLRRMQELAKIKENQFDKDPQLENQAEQIMRTAILTLIEKSGYDNDQIKELVDKILLTIESPTLGGMDESTSLYELAKSILNK